MIASARRKWYGLALLLLVQFMVVLDIAIVNVALPSIQVDLGFSQENLQWVISAYALFFGGFLLLGGRAADLLGRRRLFLAGSSLFTTASLVSGLSWGEGPLIGARAFQGLGAAIITPAALSILMTTFAEGKERNAALGAWGGVGAFGAVAGVLLGGVLTDLLSWEWIFFVNVPVGLLALVLAPFLINESRDATAESYDVPGAVLVTSGLVTLVYAITQANNFGWTSPTTIGLFAAAAALIGGFLAWEARAKDPLMPFSIFRLRTLVGANIAGFILGTALFGMFLMLTLYMQQVLGYSAMKTGVAYLAVAGSAIVTSGIAAQLVNRVGVKPVLIIGMTRADRGPRLVHAGLGRRLLLDRPLPGVPDGRRRARLLVRADLDRGARRRAAGRGRARVRAAEHVAADRRRARHRRALRDRDLHDGKRCLDGNRSRVRAHERVPGRVHRGRDRRLRRRPGLDLRRQPTRPRCRRKCPSRPSRRPRSSFEWAAGRTRRPTQNKKIFTSQMMITIVRTTSSNSIRPTDVYRRVDLAPSTSLS